ncbi:hypothetical protein LIN78_12190 [Leeia sp. TBRC 13508]|uniref:Lysis protein n=1 Tax=Leeia speluncae TaxID=2884804 RepID=A0ABS8D7Y7_9NEIS|nr:hypothetical protein [Leeia speluncae]MCB6184305.1 hypothetical protein [Leeia speluncae]
MNLIPAPYRWAVIGLLMLAVAIVAYLKGASAVMTEWELTDAKAYAAEMQRFKTQQENTNVTINQLQQDRTDISNRLQSALVSLHNRPSRMPETARAHIKGTAGSELSREDASFLVGESARADRLQAALKACYQYADDLQR